MKREVNKTVVAWGEEVSLQGGGGEGKRVGEGQSQQSYTNLEKATGRKCEHDKGLKTDVLQTSLG